jgi:hypothetical protein
MDLGIMASVLLVVMTRLIRRNFLIHVARLEKQSGEIREKASIIGLGTYSAFCAL